MLSELKEKVFQANIDIYKKGLVIYTWGNVSGIDREKGIIAIKPSGVDYDTLKPEDMVLVGLDGQVIEGAYNPSTDTKTHLVLYNHFETVEGVVHTHAVHSTVYAQAHEPIPCLGTTHADHFYGEIPVTEMMTDEEIGGDYETETGRLIVRTFEEKHLNPADVPAVLVASHGPFVWGSSVDKAVYNAVTLEEIAKMALYTSLLNPDIRGIKQTLLDKHYLRKHGKDSYYGQQNIEGEEK
ncbi:MAG: L-ribulose-5-phosphate 4-epimerase [FCB group bacterium]|nr:L-ribulose-5-phosphate 4-epimerase [FCB group bacterium]